MLIADGYAEWHFAYYRESKYHFAGWHYIEWWYADYHDTECSIVAMLNGSML